MKDARLVALVGAAVLLFAGCNIDLSNASSDPIRELAGNSYGNLTDLKHIHIGSFGVIADDFWSDAGLSHHLNWSGIVSVPGHTIVDFEVQSDQYLHIELAEDLDPDADEQVVFDTTKVFYWSEGSGYYMQHGAYRFKNASVSIAFH